MEDAGRPDGRADDQWRASDAPAPWLHAGLQTRPVARDLRLWQRVHSEGDPICTATGQDGGWLDAHTNEHVSVRVCMHGLYMRKGYRVFHSILFLRHKHAFTQLISVTHTHTFAQLIFVCAIHAFKKELDIV